VYSLVANGISKIINSITSAISPSIGNLYALGDKKELNKKFDLYEYITLALVFVFFGVGVLLITPFVMIYTKNINDANYLQPVFGILLLFAEGVYALRSPYVNLAYDANKFKEISKYAYIETAINIVTSVILVSSFGLVGVAIGTLAAMVYRTVAHVFYLKNNILYRPVHRFFNRVLVFLAPIAAAILLFAHFYPVTEYTIMSWLIHAAVYTATIVVIVAVISFVFFKNDLNTLNKYLKHRH
jgi:O-antigen/teichoic acid export membrane protein